MQAHRSGQRLRRQVRQRQRLGLGRRPTSCSPRPILRMGVPVSPRNIFPSNIQGLPTWYEVRVSEHGLRWPARRHRHDGGDEPADLGRRRRAEVEPGGYLFYDSTQPLPPIAVPRRHQRHRHAGDRDLQRRLRRPAPAHSCSRTSWCSGALSVLMDVDAAVIESLFGEQYKGKESACWRRNVRALHAGPRLRHAITCGRRRRRHGPAGAARRPGGRAHLRRRQQRPPRWAASTAAPRSCAWYPITPSSSVAEAFERYCRKYRVDPTTRREPLRHHPGRGRDRLDRHRHRRRLERRARLHRDVGPRRLADDRVHRRWPTSPRSRSTIIDVQRGGPSTGMPTRTQQADLDLAAPTRRTATPST